MPRIAETEIERIKTEVSLLDWVRGEGLEVVRKGKDWVVLCPFHEENTPSCVITPEKNLFHCFGCGAGGSVIDWVMRRRGISFPHAVEVLRSGTAGPVPESRYAAQHIEPLVPMDASTATALREVADYYHRRLLETPEALAWLEGRGIGDRDLIETFRLGYCDRTLTYRLPSKHTKAGKTIRATLREAGIFRKTMFEHFGGCVVVPVLGPDGAVQEMYGRKIRPDSKIGKSEMKHGYLPGPHRGVWNAALFEATDEVILCEALIDAMSFWVNGFRNVTALFGTTGFSADLKAMFETHPIRRVFIAFDRDEAGDRAADQVGAWLGERGIEVRRVMFPKKMDANEYALKVQPAAKALDHLLRSAPVIHGGNPGDDDPGGDDPPGAGSPGTSTSGTPTSGTSTSDTATSSPVLRLAADRDRTTRDQVVVTEEPGQVWVGLDDRRYRVRGLENNAGFGALKVNLMVMGAGASAGEAVDAPFHVDTLDLYQARQRTAFTHQASVELGVAEERIKRDLGQVLLRLEMIQTDRLREVLEVEPEEPGIGAEDRARALDLLRAPDLVDRLLSDVRRLGVVGEDVNVLTGYLAATSRKLDRPLAVIIQSSSAAGKSSLMEAVLALMPEEERVQYSALTGQSLFYMGETSLKHKILAIAEEEGAQNASYALKLLQSEGAITIASTGKDDATGQLVTKEYRVEGPVTLFLTTTAIDIDEELLNRCLVLTVNESRAQTRAIHAAQRHRQTLEGVLEEIDRDAVLRLHRTAQRLIRPLKVVNPFADRLSFADGQTRTRRDHLKYLGLIASIALLHQHAREVKQVERRGERIEYVEVTEADIDLANRLAGEVLVRTLDVLPPQTRKLLAGLRGWLEDRAGAESMALRDIRFRRREVRAALGWSDTALKVHLKRLVEMEYLELGQSSGRGGVRFEYRLAEADGDDDDGEWDSATRNPVEIGLGPPSDVVQPEPPPNTDPIPASKPRLATGGGS